MGLSPTANSLLASTMIYEYCFLNDSMGLEELFERACKNKEIPGAVLVANGPGKSLLIRRDS